MYNKENLAKLKRMGGLAPQVMEAFWAFDKAAVAEGAIPVKYKELIAIAVALTTPGEPADPTKYTSRDEVPAPMKNRVAG